MARVPQRQGARHGQEQPGLPRKKGGHDIPDRAASEAPQAADDYVTVVFDSDDEYVRFTDSVDAQFGAGAWDLTDQPILTSIRVRRDVLAETQGLFGMHEFGEPDQALIEQLPKPRKWPFDAELIRQTPIPGVPDTPAEK